MADAEKAPEFLQLVQDWAYQHLGLAGTVLATLVGAGFFVWTHWEKVIGWPGISQIVSGLARRRIPRADPHRFSVLVAHLENDKDGEHERLLASLVDEFEGVQVLRLDRTIAVQGSDPEKMELNGHARARQYLQQSGASVLIWGEVLKLGSETRPRLYLTAGPMEAHGAKQYAASDIAGEFRLPDVFWSDLAQVLRLVIASRYTQFREKDGHYIADRLPPFIGGVRRLLNESRGRPGWDADARGSTLVVVADSLATLGEQTGQNESLQEAATAYEEALQEYTRERAPLDWAMTQNNLGGALLTLGERERGTERLEEAVEAYRAALQELTRERVPLQWATTQNNLGFALTMLGERQGGKERLDEAVEAHRAALQEFARERLPLDWAMTQNNLGNALAVIGERESGTRLLEEAAAAYRAALQEWTRERVPLDWAMTQNNLGNALAALGERESGTQRLEEAVAAYRAALQEWTRERVPLQWAMTQNNLGAALRSLGERESSTERLKRAVEAHKGALEVFKAAGAEYYVTLARGNLGRARASLQELGQAGTRPPVAKFMPCHCERSEAIQSGSPRRSAPRDDGFGITAPATEARGGRRAKCLCRSSSRATPAAGQK